MKSNTFFHSEMTPNENLHYALGLIAYAMAYADGNVQQEEREKFHALVEAELKQNHEAFNISEIIFKILDNGHAHDRENMYNSAIHQLQVNSHYLSPALKQTFLNVAARIAEAYPPVTKEENILLEKFRRDIGPLNGDPIYYRK